MSSRRKPSDIRRNYKPPGEPGSGQAGQMSGQVCASCGRTHGTKTARGYVLLTENMVNRKRRLICGFCGNSEIKRLIS
jgi:hypothetical protein